jgi:Uma2 family endonuclease
MVDKERIAVSLADLQRLDAEDLWVEVEDGEIITLENNVTILHVIIIQNLYDLLKPYVVAGQLGMVFTDGVRYLLAGTPTDIERARKPDFSFVRAARITPDMDWTGDFIGAPDLAVEVASPGQTNAVLLPRITRFLEAGSEEAWLIYPWLKTLYQYRRDGDAPVLLGEADTLETPLFPGLPLALREVFRTP